MGPKPNFRCEVADVKEEIHIEFRGMLCVSMEYDKPCQENISQYIQSDYFLQQLFI